MTYLDRGEEGTCAICAASFKKRSWNQAKCGSDTCLRTHLRRRYAANPHPTLPLHNCHYCGKAIEPPLTSRARYCSKYCVRAATRIRGYGAKSSDYMRIVREQNGYCAACGEPFVDGERTVVDHDHNVKRIRGVVHHGCNVALGFALENPARLRALADYVEHHTMGVAA